MEPTNDSQQIGYLLGKQEEMNALMMQINDRLGRLEQQVEDKFRTAETVFKTLKFVGLVALAILTFKFGDITKWWQHFFG